MDTIFFRAQVVIGLMSIMHHVLGLALLLLILNRKWHLTTDHHLLVV